jgi:methyl-accepting chemotaxis protein
MALSLRGPSILRNVFLGFVGFGLTMGAAFPFFADLFVVWKDGMYAYFSAAALVAGLLVGVFNYVILKVLLLRRLRRIAEVATAISQNDISHHCVMQSNDLIGEIIGSFNRMAENLRNMIRMISEVTTQLGSAADRVATISAKTNDSMGNQQTETAVVASAIDQMIVSVQEVARNTADAAASASAAAQEARSGALVATNAITSIDRLNDEIQNAARTIDKVKVESQNIRSVLDVIHDITEKTNLLALNAAIEAARAGDQGRGFAVVADEVRTLARRTQDSTREINDMIERLGTQVEAAVTVMSEASSQAMESEGKVEEAATSLAEIAGTVKRMNDMNDQIASATEEQSAAASEIHHNLASIKGACERSADSMLEATGATEELTELSDRLHALVGQFRV